MKTLSLFSPNPVKIDITKTLLFFCISRIWSQQERTASSKWGDRTKIRRINLIALIVFLDGICQKSDFIGDFPVIVIIKILTTVGRGKLEF